MCLSVSLLVTNVSSTKTVEPIEVLLAGIDSGAFKEPYITWGPGYLYRLQKNDEYEMYKSEFLSLSPNVNLLLFCCD